jgi:hypothetical protein
MTAKFLGLVVSAAATLLSFTSSARANVLAYAETLGGGFEEIDLSTGAFTTLGLLSARSITDTRMDLIGASSFGRSWSPFLFCGGPGRRSNTR